MRAARVVLIALGALMTLFGGWELLITNRPASLLGLAVWVLGALALHDGVLAAVVVFTNRLLRTVLTGSSLVAAQVGLGVCATFALLWVPVVLAKAKGPQVTALPLQYGVNLLAVLLVSGLITALVITLAKRKQARRVSKNLDQR